MHFDLGDWKSQQQLQNLPPQVGFQLPKGNFADVGAVSTAVFYNICLHSRTPEALKKCERRCMPRFPVHRGSV
ncbi:MAG TPA: hypothetical protein ENJ02_04425 [Chloroflexi bacterium]|nr:hypothetical protein [Chloroflexota bacterium]